MLFGQTQTGFLPSHHNIRQAENDFTTWLRLYTFCLSTLVAMCDLGSDAGYAKFVVVARLLGVHLRYRIKMSAGLNCASLRYLRLALP
eukprot:COSAG01_NODE_512_length_16051_cov_33.887161_23_plen_88_part_00